MSRENSAAKELDLNDVKNGAEIGKLLYFVFKRAAETEEVRHACYSLVTEFANIWAKDSGLKRSISRGLEKSLKKGLLESRDEDSEARFADLFDDPQFIRVLGTFLPAIIDKGLEITGVFAGAIEKLPTAEKEQLFQSQIHGEDISRLGEILTTALRIVNEIHGEKPVFYADKTQIAFRNFIENVDFGELKEVVDGALDDLVRAASGCNDEIWQYPAKVVAILSLIPSLLNLSIRVLEDSLGRFNEVAPDLLTDIIISFVREVDFKKTGLLVNQLTELIRKIHTGSALLGEAEKPKFTSELEQVFRDIFEKMDGELWLRSAEFLKDARQALDSSALKNIQDDYDLSRRYLARFYLGPNEKVERATARLSMFEELDDDDAADSVSKGLSALEMQEVAEVVNMTSALVNRVQSMKPQLVRATMSQFAQALDLSELAEASRTILGEAEEEIQPIFRATLPPIITSICNSLTPQTDEFEDEVAEARRAVRELLSGE